MNGGAAPLSGPASGPATAPAWTPAGAPATWAPVAPEHRGADAWDLPQNGALPRLDGAPALEHPVSRQPLDAALRGALGREPSHEERERYGELHTAMRAAGKTDAQFTDFVRDASARTAGVVDEVVQKELDQRPDFFRLPMGGDFHAAAVAMMHEQPGRGLESVEKAVRALVQDAPEWKLKRPDEWARRVAQRVTGDAGAADREKLGARVSARARELLADRSATRRDVVWQIEYELGEHLASLAPLARAA